MRKLILAGALGLAASCATPVGPAPIVPSVSDLDACTITYLAKVRYTYTVHGSGYWWGHSASGNSLVEHLRDGSKLVFVTRGETWVYFADDADDDHIPAIEAPGGHQPAIWPANKECAP